MYVPWEKKVDDRLDADQQMHARLQTVVQHSFSIIIFIVTLWDDCHHQEREKYSPVASFIFLSNVFTHMEDTWRLNRALIHIG